LIICAHAAVCQADQTRVGKAKWHNGQRPGYHTGMKALSFHRGTESATVEATAEL